MRSHRVLVVLDDVRGPAPFDAPPEGLGSLLITTRISGPCLVDLKARKDAKRAPLMEEEAERLWRAISLCRGDGFRWNWPAEWRACRVRLRWNRPDGW